LAGAAAGAGVITGVFVGGWSAAITDAETTKHNAAATAAARAIEARPRSELSYIIGLGFLVISGADAPVKDGKAPGAETALAASNVAGLQS
jgi:hypothetical protein